MLSGFDFYENQGSGLGEYFIESLYSDIESLRLYAGTHHQISGFYKLLSKRFPYAVYYRVQRNDVYIWRILDCRRDPHWISQQLKSRR